MNDYKKKLVIKIILSFICVAVLMFIAILAKDAFVSEVDGEINVVFVDVDGSIISDKNIEFKKGDTLIYLLENNYENITLNDGMIMTFEHYVTPSDWSTFISIYVNDEASNVGILDIKFEDGTKISLVITQYVPY